jgi:hypothetical protein
MKTAKHEIWRIVFHVSVRIFNLPNSIKNASSSNLTFCLAYRKSVCYCVGKYVFSPECGGNVSFSRNVVKFLPVYMTSLFGKEYASIHSDRRGEFKSRGLMLFVNFLLWTFGCKKERTRSERRSLCNKHLHNMCVYCFADQEIISGRNVTEAHSQCVMLDDELLWSIFEHSHSDIIHRKLFAIFDVLRLRFVVEQPR